MPSTRSRGKNNIPTGQATITQSTATEPHSINTQHSRSTATHVFFWGGILSNWCVTSPTFSGTRCLEIMLPKLEALGIQHPPPGALSTQILAAHEFICGEQWMMAVKAWLFERTSELGEMLVDKEQAASSDQVIDKDQYDTLQSAVLQHTPPKEFTTGTKERALYDGTLYAILKAPTPRAQKALGRQVDGFDDKVWNKASTSIVVASCVARAEVDPELKRVYQDHNTKKFVEGSPVDRIWGVGLKWDNPQINNEANWRGQNRLGKCHDEAAKYVTQNSSA